MAGDEQRFLERLPLATDRPVLAYGSALVLSVIALLIREAVAGQLPIGFPYVTFFPAVIVTSFFFGRGPGIFAAILCGLFAWAAFIAPNQGYFSYSTIVALLFYLFVVATDILLIHWMQMAYRSFAIERERSAALVVNRELLFRELQHRISNKLQIIAGLLTLQRRRVKDDVASNALKDAARRVALIGRISRALHDPTHEGLELERFLRKLMEEILDASGRDDVAVSIDCAGDVALDDDAAVPFALIFAECVSNALEHGFPDRAGRIEVQAGRSGAGRLQLVVRDDGRGVPAGFDVRDSDSMGLQIATMLAGQLGGRFTLEPAPGGQGALARLDIRG